MLDPKKDLLVVLGVFVGIGILWLLSGGPDSASSYGGLFIDPF